LGVTLLLAALLALARRTGPSLECAAAPGVTQDRSAWIAGAWMGLAVMAKLHAALALPLLWPRIGWRGLLMSLAVITACLLPFLGAGPHLMEGAQNMAQGWSANGSLYPLLRIGFRFAGLSVFATHVLCGAL